MLLVRAVGAESRGNLQGPEESQGLSMKSFFAERSIRNRLRRGQLPPFERFFKTSLPCRFEHLSLSVGGLQSCFVSEFVSTTNLRF